jgi:hypothetical protein
MTGEEVFNNGQQAIFNYDSSKTFIWNPRFATAAHTNSGYDPVTLKAGTVLGRVSATAKVIPMKSTAVDGSQTPVGILAEDVFVEDGDTMDLTYCIGGDVAEEKVIFARVGDTFNTVVGGRIYRDLILSNTQIYLITAKELSAYDNS